MSRLDLADGLRLMNEAASGPGFGHREHLAFAWALLDEADDAEDATRVALLTIRHVTTAAGNPDKFHTTITVFWIRLLDHVRRTYPEQGSIEGAVAAYPDLADPDLPRRHFSNLDDERCRREWVEPDLAPLP